jgi:glycosyltransferase domain-containing protein
MRNKLTILLTIFNRPKHTLSWLDFYIRKSSPFEVFICDGGNDKTLEDELKKIAQNNSKIYYEKFQYYENFENFHQKFFQAVNKIKTEYIYLAEDDDFLIFQNLDKSIEFLDQNKDYVCCGGKNFEMSIYNENLYKNFAVISEQNINIFSVENATPADRVKNMIQRVYSNYNCMFRREVLASIFKNLNDINGFNLWVSELIIILHTCVLGKIKRLDHIEYIKIANIENSSSYSFFKNTDLFSLITSKKFSHENYNVLDLFKDASFDKDNSTVIEKLINNNLSEFWRKLIEEKITIENQSLKLKIYNNIKKILKILKIFDKVKFFLMILNKNYTFQKNTYFVKKKQKENIGVLEINYIKEIINLKK